MRRTSQQIFGMLIFTLGWIGCSRQPSPANDVTARKVASTGVASWYGQPFHGRLTASGETFDMEKLTAAHRTYMFGTVLRVSNKSNGKTVQVRINDRGPFVANRIIDLSRRAAQNIGMSSTTMVDLEVIRAPKTRALLNFTVQVGSFSSPTDATELVARMRKEFGAARIVFRPGDQTWRVLAGVFPTMNAADAAAQKLTGGPEGPVFVVLLDEDVP